MKNKEKILWITRTAVFIALLILLQAMSKPFGQYITGSLVNLILILATLLGGILSGSTVALVSPVMAFLLGFNHALPPVILFVMLGNLSLVFVWFLITEKLNNKNKLIPYTTATIVGAIIKTLVLYLGVIKMVIPLFNLPKPQATILSASFSFPQLITAAIGGMITILIIPVLKAALKESVSYNN